MKRGITMNSFTEADYENSIIELFQNMGYRYVMARTLIGILVARSMMLRLLILYIG